MKLNSALEHHLTVLCEDCKKKKEKSAAASIYHCRLLHSEEQILAGVTRLRGEKLGMKKCSAVSVLLGTVCEPGMPAWCPAG